MGDTCFARVAPPQALAWPWHPPRSHNRAPSSSLRLKTPQSEQGSHHLALPQSQTDEKQDDNSLKGQVFLPIPPVVPRPRASYNAASLAYLGDCVYEDVYLKQLLKDEFLSEEERDIVRWGKNVHTNHKRATKRAGTAVYCRASSLETLIGYLYLTNPSRLEEVMKKLGLTGATSLNIEKLELERTTDLSCRDAAASTALHASKDIVTEGYCIS